MPWVEHADERLGGIIGEHLEGAHIVTSWVVIAETIDEDGDRRIAVNAAPDQRVTDTLGLLRYATVVEERAVLRLFDDESDD